MLTKLRIKNFKCLQDTGELEIRPLTFLVGPNSSGKSSLFQMLLMLRQTLLSTDTESHLVPNGALVEAGAYPDFIYRHDSDRVLEVGLVFSATDPVPLPVSFTAAYSYDAASTQIRLMEWELHRTDGVRLAVRRQGNGQYDGGFSYLVNGQERTGSFHNVRVAGFSFQPPVEAERASESVRLWESMPSVPPRPFLAWHLLHTLHLGPLRDPARRSYVVSGQLPPDVGGKGERAFDVLWATQRNDSDRLRHVAAQTRLWLRKLGIADAVRLDLWEESNQFRVLLTDPATGVVVNLADVGFGASQTLPVIVQSLCAERRSTVVIEQPEIHLHPRAQSVLGDLFVEAAESGDRTFIIETHSEAILARVRRRIAERQFGITKSDVAIYYFEPRPDGTRVREVALNDQGQYDRASFPPEGFFEEDVWEAFEHLKAMRENA